MMHTTPHDIARLCFAGLLIVSAWGCAPQSIKSNDEGVSLLPPPKIGVLGDSQDIQLAGSRYASEPRDFGTGGIRITLIQFHEGGKLSMFSLDASTLEHVGGMNRMGFYSIEGDTIRTALYIYDSGIPGYRYAVRESHFDKPTGNLHRIGEATYQPTKIKMEPMRPWMLEPY